MEVLYKNNGIYFLAIYDKDGSLDHVINKHTKLPMMLETYQEGTGIKFTMNGFLNIESCSANYVRVVDANIYIPKYQFVKL